jgi:hypothetical protein
MVEWGVERMVVRRFGDGCLEAKQARKRCKVQGAGCRLCGLDWGGGSESKRARTWTIKYACWGNSGLGGQAVYWDRTGQKK